MTLKKPKPSPKGYVLNDPQSGSFVIGPNEGERPRQVEIQSQSLGCIRLFDDGGFHIRSHTNAVTKDNIESNATDGLAIYCAGQGIAIEAPKGSITLKAKDIVIESTGTDDPGITFRSATNINIKSADNLKLEGSSTTIGATNKMVIASKGLLIIRGNGGVIISEPKSKLLPTSVNDLLNTLISVALPGYF
jgi:uncharacterized protein (DUF2345 family)